MCYLGTLKVLCGFCLWSHDLGILNFHSSHCCSLTHVDNFLDTSVSKVWLCTNGFGHWHAKQQLRKNDNKRQEMFYFFRKLKQKAEQNINAIVGENRKFASWVSKVLIGSNKLSLNVFENNLVCRLKTSTNGLYSMV